MCDQRRLRSACAYAQSDQSLCLSLEYSMIVKLLTEHHLEFLSLKGGCVDSSESTLAKMPHCWKSYVVAQIQCTSYIGPRREKSCLWGWQSGKAQTDELEYRNSACTKFRYHSLQRVYNKGADQTARMCRLVSVFVAKSGFLAARPVCLYTASKVKHL